MRIAIDARMMGPLITRGIGRYVEELIRAMVLQLGSQDRFVLLVRQPEQSPFLHHPLVEHQLADIQWYSVQEQLRMPGLLRAAHADLVHVPHWNAPLLYRGPLVLTIHDLILRHQVSSAKASTRHPLFATIKRAGYRLLLRDVMQKSAHLLVPTQFVAHDVQRFYPFTNGKITVTGEGIGDFPPEDPHFVPDHPYLFYVGSAYPHKRLDVLFEAWQRMASRYPTHELLIAGEEDLFMARHVAWVKQYQVPRVRFLGRVSDAQLSALHRHASAFVFPSSNEGMGLPPLEALTHGTPVISSDASCLPEVLNTEGVFFFRNGDVDGMIGAIDAVLSDPAKARQQASHAQASIRGRFSWKQVAEHTLKAYERIVHSFSHAARFPTRSPHP